MASAPTICYCGSQKAEQQTVQHEGSFSTPLFDNPQQRPQQLICQPCATRRLASQISRHRSAKETRDRKRDECHRRLLETRLPPLRPPSIDDATTSNNPNPEQRQQQHHESLSSRRPLPDPNQINRRVSQLKHTLDALRGMSNDAAVRVTAKTVENDEREERLRENSTRVRLARERLDRMRQYLLVTSEEADDEGACAEENLEDGKRMLCERGHGQSFGGGLKDALVSGTQQIQILRFRFACRVFDMHRLDVGERYSKRGSTVAATNAGTSTKGNDSCATGVGKIGGLPLPHAGLVLYGVIPSVVLASSLRLVASLTQMVARCLGVVLPHPILVSFRECRRCGSMYDFGGDVIDDECNDQDDAEEEYVGCAKRNLCSVCCDEGLSKKHPQNKSLSEPLSSEPSQRRTSLLSLVGSSARKAISLTTSATSRAITHMQQSSTSVDSVPSSHPPSSISSSSNAQSIKPASNEVSMARESISKRINHASFAYLRENHDKSATEYVLNPPRWDEGNHNITNGNGDPDKKQTADLGHGAQAHTFSTREEFHVAEERFATGLQLLQNDVVALCFRAGVDVYALWPAESVLLNLHSLWCHCRRMAEAK